jgi:benzil reductase ((S)-benzoin forming)
MHLTIITGASRGMGLGMASLRIAQGHELLTLQRQPSAELHALASVAKSPITQWAVDLTDALPVSLRLGQWLAEHATATPASTITLINNAALLATPSTLTDADLAETRLALRASLEAPLLLSSAFLAATQDWACPRKLLNISSGLGRRAMPGTAGYCAAKAGMDHFTRALALEEATRPNGAKVVSLAPGVIDTDMQMQLRGADPDQFSEQGVFAAMKASGGLTSIDEAAQRVLRFLDSPSFGEPTVADVRG